MGTPEPTPTPHDFRERIEVYEKQGYDTYAMALFVDDLVDDVRKDRDGDWLYDDWVSARIAAMRKNHPLFYAKLMAKLSRFKHFKKFDYEKDVLDRMNGFHPDSLVLPVPQRGSDLLKMKFPPPYYFVERTVCQGLTLLAGKSKRGKTYFCLDMAMAVSFGWDAFKKLRTKQSKVLFASLEDGEILVQENLHKINPTLEALPHMDLLYEFPRMGNGCVEHLKAYLETYDMIVLDILGRILPDGGTMRKNVGEYQMITDFLGPIHDLVRDTEKSIIITDHLRKAPSDDEFDEVAGSMAKVGVADHVMLYKRDADSRESSIRILGKRINYHKIVVAYTESPCPTHGCPFESHGHLEFVGEGETYESQTEERKILEILAEEGRPIHTREIVAAMGLQPTQYHRVRMRLTRMYAEGDIGRNKGSGQWTSLGTTRRYADDGPDSDGDRGVPF